MKIAFISFEYPPDTADGGIATYARQAARMLRDRGHAIEIFAGSRHRAGTVTEEGIVVHRIQLQDRAKFAARIGSVFAARHAQVGFDVLEGPDFRAEAQEAVRLVPDIPLVVRLHTPSYLTRRLNTAPQHGGHAASTPLEYDPSADPEYLHTREADEIAAPSQAIADLVGSDWNLDRARIATIPNPYLPDTALLRLPVETQTRVVTFVGRLETRKGVLDLAEAIPQILQRCPDARFRFVGRPLTSPVPELNMREYLKRLLEPYRDSVEFTGLVPLDEIPFVLGATDLCVFPSRWENFPCVCLEAMAAARGIVGSRAGGMAEMLAGGEVGRLVPPYSPEAITEAVVALLEAPELRIALGQAARERVCAEYSGARVAALQEAGFLRAIERRRHLGPRRAVNDPT